MSEKIIGEEVKEFSKYLMKAERDQKAITPLTEIKPDITVNEAYLVQLETVTKKVDYGSTIVGKKIGLTSIAMQELLGVGEPDYGHLLDYMAVDHKGTITSNQVIQPRVEGEIAFILNKELKGPNVTVEQVLQATDYVLPALEIVDSRIADWKIKLEDTIADNASSGLFVLGDTPISVEKVDLPQLNMKLYRNGELMNTGKGSAALEDPAYCVAWLANKLADYNLSLEPGEVILSGALSAAIFAQPGDEFTAEIDVLGSVSVKFGR
ncbi:2-keto-4-pentenoate hydratase [Rossellomorea sp. BNER]|jgi:2-keto-4-pentenoate hydratase|uniref:2-keto-4-pentenoate hydratase n=1 Tax=Rossellomorea sp. BNER TaxID=2962031 RepID=UPI003AF2F953|nr:2-keto-4-pentenoate hydratase [Rossellomorea sp. BNER]